MAGTATPQRERGYGADVAPGNLYWAALDRETTPELRWPLSVHVYDRMRRQDAQVGSVLRAVTAPIMRTPWRLDGEGCRDEVTQTVAADLGLPIVGEGNETRPLRGRDRFSWRQHLQLALLMLPFGHMYFEQVYRYDETTARFRLRKLGARMPWTLTDVKVARDGGLVSIEQAGIDVAGSVTIPVHRLVAYVLDREGGNWLGHSLLRPAYKNWLIKDRLLRVQAQTVERNGMGIPVYEGADFSGDRQNAEALMQADLEAGLEIATSVRAGDNSGAATPHGASLKLLGVQGDLPDADVPIRYHDEQIARAVLAHFLNLGTQTGSWALGSTFADFFTLSLQAVADEVADTASAHIVEDLVDINFGAEEPAPRVVFDPIGSRRDATAEAIKVLRDAGVITNDDELEDFVRTSYGLPARSGASTTQKGAPGEQDS